MTETVQTLLPASATGVAGVIDGKSGSGDAQGTPADGGKAFAVELDQARAQARRSADTSATGVARPTRRNAADEDDGVERAADLAATQGEPVEAGTPLSPVRRQTTFEQVAGESTNPVAEAQVSTTRDRDSVALEPTAASLVSPGGDAFAARDAHRRSMVTEQSDARVANPSVGEAAASPAAVSRDSLAEAEDAERAGAAERVAASSRSGAAEEVVDRRPVETGSASGRAAGTTSTAGASVSRPSDEEAVAHTGLGRAASPDVSESRGTQVPSADRSTPAPGIRLPDSQGIVAGVVAGTKPSSSVAARAAAIPSTTQPAAAVSSDSSAAADTAGAGVSRAVGGEMLSQPQLMIRHRHATAGATRASTSSALPGMTERVSNSDPRMLQSEGALDAITGETVELSDHLSVEMAHKSLSRNELFQDLQRQRTVLTEAFAVTGSSLASDSAGSSMAPDNMFLSMPGGIVTAPLISRSEGMTAPLAAAPITVPLMAEDSDTALAGNVRWMAREGVQNATVNVAPAGMGPISVRVGIEQDQMSVSIVASQQATREALDASLPRLREQLMAQGHDNVKLDVSDGRGDASRNGHGQMFAGTHDSAAGWSQGGRNNSGEDGDQTDVGQRGAGSEDPDSLLAEDLQRIANRRLGSDGQSSAFDAYV